MAYRSNLMLCTCTMCVSVGALRIKDKLEEEIKKAHLDNEVQIILTGSSWLCTKGPTLIVQPDDVVYQLLKEEDIPKLVEEHLLKGRPVKSLMYAHPEELQPIEKLHQIPFYHDQRLVALWNRGMIDPDQIDEYIARDGYRALAKVVKNMTPEAVIQEVKDSGLRGRGGGGFPTGMKWEFCRKNPGTLKYLICNADEGDPGAFMDRSIIEADPHSLIEGMLIAAYAIGAGKGYIYVRIEYPLAIKRLNRAIDQAREYGLLGENIFDSGFNFDIEIFLGAGAFVCGEETSLIHSIEGHPAEPRQRPPFPVQQGLFGKPTVINNVETLSNLPRILNFGAKWFAGIGTEKSKGTKVFSLAGNINNAGLVEVPMGITLREMVYEIGGGIPKNRKFKAVQTGGPSGGVIPSSLLELPVDYERLQEAGAIMGSGGMIVMDENTCMVDVAKYFLTFTNDESCGKCTSCREGSAAMLEVLNRISAGKGKEGDIEFLEELGEAVKDASQCGLGKTLPNPLLSTIQHFREEYEAHIKYKRCSAAICKEMISSPCQHVCPIDAEVPVYIALTAKGKFKEAFEVVRKDNPFPGVCGRVCHHPCESKCRAGDGGEPIAIRAIKRFLADYCRELNNNPTLRPKKKREEKVAIIGSGPAGLTAGFYLGLEGYNVTVFEALPVIGGMLRVAIPEHRLPKKILDYDLKTINKVMTIETNQRFGEDFSVNSLFKKGYKAIFIAIGAHKSIKLNIPGEDTKGIIGSIEFLREVNLGKKVKIGKRVCIIGGGNSAVDAARVANRLPECKEVTIIYRRARLEMPAFSEEVDAAIDEGIDIKFLTAPVKIISQNGKLKAIECIRMKLSEIDQTGRRKPIPISGSEFVVELDTLIRAIGEQPDTDFLTDKDNIKITKWRTIERDPETMATSREGVFAGGDAGTGPGTVVEAISAGKVAAQSIVKFLRGESLKREYEVTRPSVYIEPIELTEEEIDESTRPQMVHLSPEERINNFQEVELGFTKEMAIKEARRCLRCDIETEDGKRSVGR
jgi:NADH-quinone oxidoreductase subunit F